MRLTIKGGLHFYRSLSDALYSFYCTLSTKFVLALSLSFFCKIGQKIQVRYQLLRALGRQIVTQTKRVNLCSVTGGIMTTAEHCTKQNAERWASLVH